LQISLPNVDKSVVPYHRAATAGMSRCAKREPRREIQRQRDTLKDTCGLPVWRKQETVSQR